MYCAAPPWSPLWAARCYKYSKSINVFHFLSSLNLLQYFVPNSVQYVLWLQSQAVNKLHFFNVNVHRCGSLIIEQLGWQNEEHSPSPHSIKQPWFYSQAVCILYFQPWECSQLCCVDLGWGKGASEFSFCLFKRNPDEDKLRKF